MPVLVMIALAGCGTPQSATSPSSLASPSSSVASTAPRDVIPAPLAHVMDTALRRVAGARVEIVTGPQAGTVLTTDADGLFTLTGPFRTDDVFRASAPGFVTATQGFKTSSPNGVPWLLFYLAPETAPVNLAGDYTLTMVADDSCGDLPSELRSRTYAATVTPKPGPAGSSDTWFGVTVNGVSTFANLNGFEIGVAGNTLGFWLDGSHDPTLVERLDTTTYAAYSGIGWVTVDPNRLSTISVAFEGWVEYCVMPSPMAGNYYSCGMSGFGEPIPGASLQRVHCESPRQQLVLTRTAAR
jgi:hypothetical protein